MKKRWEPDYYKDEKPDNAAARDLADEQKLLAEMRPKIKRPYGSAPIGSPKPGGSLY